MSRFYFDLLGERDTDGVVFADIDAAREALIQIMPEVIKDAVDTRIGEAESWSGVVRDDGNRLVCRVSLTLLVEDLRVVEDACVVDNVRAAPLERTCRPANQNHLHVVK